MENSNSTNSTNNINSVNILQATGLARAFHTFFRGARLPQQPEDDNMDDMPPLEPIPSTSSSHIGELGQSRTPAPGDSTVMDVDSGPTHNDDDNYSSMPELGSVSETSEDSGSVVHSALVAPEVEMAVDDDNDSVWVDEDEDHEHSHLHQHVAPDADDPEMPPLEPVDAPRYFNRNNRRARVEDDEDEDRDRRHPSQRTGNPAADDASSPSGNQHLPRGNQPPRFPPTFPGGPHFGPAPPPDTFRLFQHFFPAHPAHPPNINENTPNNNQDNADAPPLPGTAPQHRHQRFPILGGVTLTVDLLAPFGGVPTQAPGHVHTHGPGHVNNDPGFFGPVPPGAVAGAFAELLHRARFMGQGLDLENEQEDPERAKRLVDGQNEVPVGLIRRLERVGDVGGGEDVGGAGGDAACAICWDRLLDGESDSFAKDDHAKASEDSTSSVSPDSSADKSPIDPNFKSSHPKIVSLPCAHVFHASCLIPWFSRPKQTTCPTCRFNIDPENLTYVRRSPTTQATPTQDGTSQRRSNEPNHTDSQAAATSPDTQPAVVREAVPPNAAMNVAAGVNIAQPATIDTTAGLIPEQVRPGRSDQQPINAEAQPTAISPPPQPTNSPPVDILTFGFDMVFPMPAPGEESNEANDSDEQFDRWFNGLGATDARPAPDANGAPGARREFNGPPGMAEMFAQVIQDMTGAFLNNPAAHTGDPTGPERPAAGATPRGVPMPFFPGMGMPPGVMPDVRSRAPREKKAWTLPAAPGLTLRQRVEKQEREAGLRCHDISCGIGPSDEEPFLSLPEGSSKQLSIRNPKSAPSGAGMNVCRHTFHPSCLVSAERVAWANIDEKVIGAEVEVSCPVCRAVGCISKDEWEEGSKALA